MEKQKEEARKAWKGSGEAATETVWFEITRARRRHRFPGLRHRDGRRRDPRHRQGRQGGQEPQGRRGGARSSSTRRRSTANPAARSATQGIIKGPKGALFRVTDTQKKLGDVFVHIGTRREGRVQARRCRRADRRSRAPHGHPRQPLRHAPPARGAAPGARHARGAEGLAGGARAPALRLLPSQADERRRRSRRSRRWPTPSCCRTRPSRRG